MSRLDLLAAEARKYSSFGEFESAYSLHCMRGQYWHVTDDSNFSVKAVAPRDLSSMGSGRGASVGLMVSCDPQLWFHYFSSRRFAAQIDLSRALPDRDYSIVDRGFGHEVFVRNLDVVSVVRVVPVESAIRSARYYNDEAIPQSKEALFDFWVGVRGG